MPSKPFPKGNTFGRANKGRPSPNPEGRPANASKLALRELLLMADVGGSMRDLAVKNVHEALQDRDIERTGTGKSKKERKRVTPIAMKATEMVLAYTDPKAEHVIVTETDISDVTSEEMQRAADVVRAALKAP